MGDFNSFLASYAYIIGIVVFVLLVGVTVFLFFWLKKNKPSPEVPRLFAFTLGGHANIEAVELHGDQLKVQVKAHKVSNRALAKFGLQAIEKTANSLTLKIDTAYLEYFTAYFS